MTNDIVCIAYVLFIWSTQTNSCLADPYLYLVSRVIVATSKGQLRTE